MNVFDTHCDALLKLHFDQRLNFTNASDMHINYEYLQQGGSKVQCFALFIPTEIPQEVKFRTALDMIDIFYRQVVEAHDNVRAVRTKADIEALQENEIGAMLTLEGCDAIDTDLMKLRTLFRLGVRAVGLTWNNANATADGAEESRGAGLSDFGRELVRQNNAYKVWTDVSHLNVKSFWDCIEEADYPIASHSNARAIYDHPRNLYDDQIKALIEKNGVIGINFVPYFLNESKTASIDDILKHIEHICTLGGAKNIGFGSDFDGIRYTPIDLKNFSHYPKLVDRLLQNYDETLVKGFLYDHFFNALPE
ncbi:membrane dipeptidase [Pullulanibacillus pueri]|uniref:Diguanylate cyclase n=1 Tax=Pullulanibacillus pueri TaxID=1437324 RepID=A0A8J2ZWC7_9BACL|nr:dipeptidase [Pullulanibacillus pueri]MBM7682550.1 membrane dipeptidase [Pullulanibacillus pueri]GGH81961.1 diguanylate cyclase [Pullulanibacillus pueri]